jgi:hypothetical protein
VRCTTAFARAAPALAEDLGLAATVELMLTTG